MRRLIAAALPLLAITLAAKAWALNLPPVIEPMTIKECGACHMVFPPQLLPARSWTALMGNLANHFDEIATLDASTLAAITGYLTANAADAPVNAGKFDRLLRGVLDTGMPLRITEMPWFKRRHGEVSTAAFARPNVKSAANCVACHTGADKGVFREPGD